MLASKHVRRVHMLLEQLMARQEAQSVAVEARLTAMETAQAARDATAALPLGMAATPAPNLARRLVESVFFKDSGPGTSCDRTGALRAFRGYKAVRVTPRGSRETASDRPRVGGRPHCGLQKY